MDGSFSMTSVRAHEHVMAVHRKQLMMSMMANSTPSAMHSHSSQGGCTPPSHSSATTATGEQDMLTYGQGNHAVGEERSRDQHVDLDLQQRIFFHGSRGVGTQGGHWPPLSAPKGRLNASVRSLKEGRQGAPHRGARRAPKMGTLVVPATSASAERSFSLLRGLKTYLRTTMTAERLNHLAVLNCYQEEVDNSDVNNLIYLFVNSPYRAFVFGKHDSVKKTVKMILTSFPSPITVTVTVVDHVAKFPSQRDQCSAGGACSWHLYTYCSHRSAMYFSGPYNDCPLAPTPVQVLYLRGASPGSSTNTLVLAMSAPSSACSASWSRARDCAVSPEPRPRPACCSWKSSSAQLGSGHGPRHSAMSHWKCSWLESGNRNMERSSASAELVEGSYLNGEMTDDLSGHLQHANAQGLELVCLCVCAAHGAAAQSSRLLHNKLFQKGGRRRARIRKDLPDFSAQFTFPRFFEANDPGQGQGRIPMLTEGFRPARPGALQEEALTDKRPQAPVMNIEALVVCSVTRWACPSLPRVPEAGLAARDDVELVVVQLQGPVHAHRHGHGPLLRLLQTHNTKALDLF
ncbi:Zinc finger MYM-type protein 1, partial [Frankliniella fusca]